MSQEGKIKLFVSHASEDKADFVEELVAALQPLYEVWYDRTALTMGDSLLDKINEGIAACDYGVVVFSKSFFPKKWTRAEMDGLFSRQTASRKLILPIWKDVTVEEMIKHYPIFAGKWAAQASDGIQRIVDEIGRAVAVASEVKTFPPADPLKRRVDNLAAKLKADAHSRRVLETLVGVSVIRDAFREMAEITANLARGYGQGEIPFTVIPITAQRIVPNVVVETRDNIFGEITVTQFSENGVNDCKLRITVNRTHYEHGEYKSRSTIRRNDFKPYVNEDNRMKWIALGDTVKNEDIPSVLFDMLLQTLEKG